MFARLIASLTRPATIAPVLGICPRPALALVPVSAAPVRGYDYGRAELRRRALEARAADRRWS